MTYFELFEVPESFEIDLKLLKKKFLLLSRKYHPDFYTLKDAQEQNMALEMSAAINRAYKVLKDEEKLTSYILSLNDIETSDKEAISQEFLMEMMDINERLMELQFDPRPKEKQSLIKEIKGIEDDIKNEMFGLKMSYNVNNSKKTLLHSIKNLHLKMKYLSRLNSQIISM